MYQPEISKNGTKLNLYKVLKIGKIVVLKQFEDEDLFALPKEKLWERIYRVIGIQCDGRIKLTHIIIASTWDKKTAQKGPIDNQQNFRLVSVNQTYCAVEGTDFTISPTGEIFKKEQK